ncbi:MAG TPA: peptidoglycan-binding domain-containing protein [Ilumatobacteraceae bacterium]|nr:peptidoglycan-binding domain-containing protein [Ilumatobacteraceae bacterium]
MAIAVMMAGAVALTIIAVPLARYPSRPTLSFVNSPVAVAQQTTALSRAATATILWEPGRVIRTAVIASGTVTRVGLEAGTPATCGESLLQIDGADVIGYCGPEPLWRAISSASQGRDVDELVTFLRSTGFLAGSGAPTEPELTHAVEAMQAHFGYPATGTVSPAMFVWLGSAGFTPDVVEITAGTAISGSTEVASSKPQISAVTVQVAAGDPPSVATKLVFNLTDSPGTFDIAPDGSVADVVGFSAAAGDRLQDANGGLVTSLGGVVSLSTPITAAAVPISSIVRNAGVNCVVPVEGHPVRVDIVDSQLQLVLVTGDLLPGTLIQSQPSPTSEC